MRAKFTKLKQSQEKYMLWPLKKCKKEESIDKDAVSPLFGYPIFNLMTEFVSRVLYALAQQSSIFTASHPAVQANALPP